MLKPTRGELLRLKKRIQLAKKGHDLLKKKQDSLVIEFFSTLKDIKAHQKGLYAEYAAAARKLDMARSLESDLKIRAATIIVQEAAPVELELRSIAGVKVPVIRHEEREHPRHDSLLLQEVGGAFTEVLEKALVLAAKETALRKLLIEIRKTKRRAHALEEIFIPSLERDRDRIVFELEERSREEFTRLKKRKPESAHA